ncbi:hypothetical protein BB559_002308 [Furculomyces boomerangus]|uniref:RGS domain-containing protein n=1 Tax=Furculomyces boomerangus TaxID=61424 RepID=A0A2T9YWB7_9FUNG|nr:hypothetical protein BB559_002308 [Furculomyces boomerangus]
MNQGDLIQTNFVNNDQVLEAIPILTANINDVDDLITPTTPTRTTTSESSSKTQSSSTSKSTKSSQTTTSETKSPSKTEGPSGTTSPSGTGSPNRPMGPSGPGGPDGPPPIIGMGLDQSDAHLLTLKSRYSNNSEPQFIVLTIILGYFMMGKAMYLPLLTFFILLFVSHILCVVYPQFKMKDYSVAYTIDDYANQDARRATRSMSKNFKSSYSGKTADYRREFLGMLDNEELYSQLREFSKHYLSYSLIQFLDEYQVLKKRILEEYSVEDKVSHRYTNNSNNSRESMISKAHSSDTLSFERSSIKDSESKHSNFSGFYVPTDGLDDKSGYNSRKLTNKSSVYPSVIVDRLLANTPISITISDALEYIFPQAEIFPTSPIPPKIRGLYKFFYSSFIDPNSSLSINLHGSIVDEIIANFKAGDLTVGLFDDAREEVLDLIYFGVFPYYLSSRNIKKVRPTSKVSKISGYILQEKSN